MSGSEIGETNSREPFLQSPSGLHNLNTDYSSVTNAIYKPFAAATSPPPFQSSAGAGGPVAAAAPAGGDVSVGAGGGVMPQPAGTNMNMGGGGGGAEPIKRKRGRPRKYGPDGTMSMALSPSAAPPAAGPVSQSTGAFSPPPAPASGGVAASTTSAKKTRGRPPGSTKKQQQVEAALGSAGFAFTPHLITVKAGEDVSSKIMSFSQNGPRAICILSAVGTISNVTLQQATTSGGTVTYEGRFDIVSVSGSFLLSENDGHRSITGGLSVALSSSDGRVLGGCVAGLLIAASPVQVIVASFALEGRKESAGPRGLAAAGIPNGVSSPPSHGTLSESSGGQGSPLNQSAGAGNNNNPQGMSSMSWK